MPAQFRVTSPTQLRREPNRNAQIIAELSLGTVVERDGRKERRWVPVRHQGRAGWVVERVLERIGDSGSDRIPNGNADPNRVWSEAELVQIIREAARAFGQPEEDMLRVARCESVLDPRAVNPQGPWLGLFQFHRTTWASTPFADRDIFDPVANANAAAWMWREGRRGEWTCQ